MAVIYRETKEETKAPTYTVERCEGIVNYITTMFSDSLPRTTFKLYEELRKSTFEPTEKLITWLNVIANLLREKSGKMVMTPRKAETIEFLIGG